MKEVKKNIKTFQYGNSDHGTIRQGKELAPAIPRKTEIVEGRVLGGIALLHIVPIEIVPALGDAIRSIEGYIFVYESE